VLVAAVVAVTTSPVMAQTVEATEILGRTMPCPPPQTRVAVAEVLGIRVILAQAAPVSSS